MTTTRGRRTVIVGVASAGVLALSGVALAGNGHVTLVMPGANGTVLRTSPVATDSVSGTAALGVDGGGTAGPVIISAQKAAGAADTTATGSFDGATTLTLGGMPTGLTPLHLAGPVDCLQVVGNRAGLIYPVTSSNLPGVTGMAVRITVVDNGGGGEDQLGFVGPLPENLLGGCAPSVALLPVAGHFTVHQG